MQSTYLLLFLVGKCICHERATFTITTTTSTSIPRTKALLCGQKYAGLNYPAYRINNDGDVCEDIPFTWLSNKIFESGYIYFVKKSNHEELIPAMTVYETATDHVEYVRFLPGPLETGVSLHAYVKIPSSMGGMDLELKDLTSSTMYLGVTFMSNQTVFTRYMSATSTVVDTYGPYPFQPDVLYHISLQFDEGQTVFSVNDVTMYSCDRVTPMDWVRLVRIGAPEYSEGYLHKLEYLTS